RLGRRAALHAVHAVARVQHPGAAAHRAPAPGGRLGGVRLAEDLAVELEHRVAADDDPVEVRVGLDQARCDIRRLAPGQQQHVLGGGERAALGGFDRRDDGVLVDLRRQGLRLDARLPQQHESGGGGRGEAHAHAHEAISPWESRRVAADETFDLDITDVAHGGVFIGRHEGRVVFVPDAIPGERVRVRRADSGDARTDAKRFWRAELREVLDPSPHRRPHVWRQADVDVPPHLRPGGADFGHIELARQRTLKLQVLTDALRRIGGLPDAAAAISAASPARSADGDVLDAETADGTAWRTRVSLHADAEGRVGPYAARSHRVIAVDELPLATP